MSIDLHGSFHMGVNCLNRVIVETVEAIPSIDNDIQHGITSKLAIDSEIRFDVPETLRAIDWRIGNVFAVLDDTRFDVAECVERVCFANVAGEERLPNRSLTAKVVHQGLHTLRHKTFEIIETESYDTTLDVCGQGIGDPGRQLDGLLLDSRCANDHIVQNNIAGRTRAIAICNCLVLLSLRRLRRGSARIVDALIVHLQDE
jgi:hypothetical protein